MESHTCFINVPDDQRILYKYANQKRIFCGKCFEWIDHDLYDYLLTVYINELIRTEYNYMFYIHNHTVDTYVSHVKSMCNGYRLVDTIVYEKNKYGFIIPKDINICDVTMPKSVIEYINNNFEDDISIRWSFGLENGRLISLRENIKKN